MGSFQSPELPTPVLAACDVASPDGRRPEPVFVERRQSSETVTLLTVAWGSHAPRGEGR